MVRSVHSLRLFAPGGARLCICALLAASGIALRAEAATPPLPDPIATRQSLFTIPFRVAPPRSPAAAPAEVQLYVSDDHGLNWRLDSRLDPREGRFTFRAPHDGEYWFQVRTIDRNGHALPQPGRQPGLAVLVDTVPPSLELFASQDVGGEIVANWRAVDPFLDAASLRLTYQVSASGPWQPVGGNMQDTGRGPQTSAGTVRFRPPAGVDSLAVRAEICDRAGNLSVQQTMIHLLRRPSLASFPPAAPAGQTAENGPAPWRPSLAPLAPEQQRVDGSTPWPADRTAMGPLDARSRAGGGVAPPSRNDPPMSARQLSPPATQLAALPRSDDFHSGANPTNSSWPPAQQPGPGPRNSGPSNVPPANAGAGPGAALEPVTGHLYDSRLLPAGVTPQQVNSLQFQVDYSVQSVGSSGIRRVELFGTRDGGRTWSSFGVDNNINNNSRTPLLATVPGNGLYGFRIIVTDTEGRGEPAPRAGDTPQIWIAVDASPPDVKLLAAETRGDEIQIIYQATDEQLDPQGISLFYSHRADGGWIPIAERVANTGQYGWIPDARLSGPAFIRVEARDLAGNVGAAVTREPILLDRPVPKTTINGIRAR